MLPTTDDAEAFLNIPHSKQICSLVVYQTKIPLVDYQNISRFFFGFFNMDLCQRIREMGKRGQSAYPVDGAAVVDIPPQACAGRSSACGKTFTGCLNLQTGHLRIDCAEDLSFYLEIDLSKVPAFAAQPSGPDGIAAVERVSRNC